MDKTTKLVLYAILLSLIWVVVFRNEYVVEQTMVAVYNGCTAEQIAQGCHGDAIVENFNWLGIPSLLGKIGIVVLVPFLVVHRIRFALKRSDKSK